MKYVVRVIDSQGLAVMGVFGSVKAAYKLANKLNADCGSARYVVTKMVWGT